MHYLITGLDGKDSEAPQRRLDARAKHLELGKQMREAGVMLFAAAILNEKEEMIGSSIVCEFEDRKDLDTWLENEPYVLGKVWSEISVVPCKVGAGFL